MNTAKQSIKILEDQVKAMVSNFEQVYPDLFIEELIYKAAPVTQRTFAGLNIIIAGDCNSKVVLRK